MKVIETKKEIKKYDEDFKKSSVELYLRSGKKQRQFARELGVAYETFRGWLNKYAEADKAEPATDKESLDRYRKELMEAKMENELLKKAIAIFSKNLV